MTTDHDAIDILNVPPTPRRAPALIVRGSDISYRDESLSGEEPLQIRACGPGQEPLDVAITMRTPGTEQELALGFLVSEGLVARSAAAKATFEFGDPAVIAQPEDEILVRLPERVDLDALAERHFVATASCGICGRATLDELTARVPFMDVGTSLSRSVLERLPDDMRAAQATFAKTGGLHAAALFSVDGELHELREDVGRHNAVDKVIGGQARASRLPLSNSVLLVSGRTSFEIVQKTATAGIPILAAVSAPSDLAVETADRLGMTLIGFLRGDGFNVYTHQHRILLDDTLA
jgi:FdhD protein